MKYTRETILDRYNQGEELSFLFFWGHTVTPGKVTSTCFSQWYPCEFTVDEVEYHTAEQYMMAQKAKLFGDDEIFRQIMEADNPREYKSLGRKVKGFSGAIWDEHKYDIVLSGSLAKFSQNPEFQEFLLGTGDSIIVEASPYDAIWGVRMSAKNTAIQNPNNWKGENLLGFALMEARDLLRSRAVSLENLSVESR